MVTVHKIGKTRQPHRIITKQQQGQQQQKNPMKKYFKTKKKLSSVFWTDFGQTTLDSF